MIFRRPVVAAALMIAVLSGCAEKPEAVFKELKTAGLAKDSRAVWARLTPSTKADLAKRASGFFGGMSGGAAAEFAPSDPEVYEYFSGLVAGLDDLSLDYIRSLRAGKVTVESGTAEISLGSLRYGPPPMPIKFERADGRWFWDAREALEWYLLHRRQMLTGGY